MAEYGFSWPAKGTGGERAHHLLLLHYPTGVGVSFPIARHLTDSRGRLQICYCLGSELVVGGGNKEMGNILSVPWAIQEIFQNCLWMGLRAAFFLWAGSAHDGK